MAPPPSPRTAGARSGQVTSLRLGALPNNWHLDDRSSRNPARTRWRRRGNTNCWAKPRRYGRAHHLLPLPRGSRHPGGSRLAAVAGASLQQQLGSLSLPGSAAAVDRPSRVQQRHSVFRDRRKSPGGCDLGDHATELHRSITIPSSPTAFRKTVIPPPQHSDHLWLRVVRVDRRLLRAPWINASSERNERSKRDQAEDHVAVAAPVARCPYPQAQ